jgi:hypothetical protein
MRKTPPKEKTTAELTNEYIREHPYVKACLKRGMVNYSSLARLVAKELGIGKASSKEAIVVAARRFGEKLKGEADHEKNTMGLLSKSEMDIKNKIAVFVAEKSIDLERVDEIQKAVRKESGTFYIIEGSGNYTIITQEKYSGSVREMAKSKIIEQKKELILITLRSPEAIEETTGVLYYITSLFAENGINLVELISCWTDTLLVIGADDMDKAVKLLRF